MKHLNFYLPKICTCNFLITILFSCLLNIGISRTIFVSQAFGSDSSSGASWFESIKSVEHALKVASYSDEIWVAEGNYFPTNTGDRAARFILKMGVKLFGGFNGTETNLNQRDISKHKAILDGNINLKDSSTDNSYTVLEVLGSDDNTRIDGITIQNGNSSFSNVEPFSCLSNGAGIYFDCNDKNSGSIHISNCSFTQNFSCNEGGAIYLCPQSVYSNIEITNTTFSLNSATRGAAIEINGIKKIGKILFNNVSFVDNINKFGTSTQILYTPIDSIQIVDCSFINSFSEIHGSFVLLDHCRVIADKIDELILSNPGFHGSNYVFEIGTSMPSSKPLDLVVSNSYFEYYNYFLSFNLLSGTEKNTSTLFSNNKVFIHQSKTIYRPGDGILDVHGGATIENSIFQNVDLSEFNGSGDFDGFAHVISATGKIQVINSLFKDIINIGSRVIAGSGVSIYNSIFDNIFTVHNYFTKEGYVDLAYDNTLLSFGNQFIDTSQTVVLRNNAMSIYSKDYLPYFEVIGFDKIVKFNQYDLEGNIFNVQPEFDYFNGYVVGIKNCSKLKNKGFDSIVVASNIKFDINQTPRVKEEHVDIGPFEFGMDCITTQTKEENAINLFEMFPNPVRLGAPIQLAVTLTGIHDAIIVVYDILGREIFRKKFLLGANGPLLYFEAPEYSGTYVCKFIIPSSHLYTSKKFTVLP